jgi:tetratricopeptide (TPR) repeat protein
MKYKMLIMFILLGFVWNGFRYVQAEELKPNVFHQFIKQENPPLPPSEEVNKSSPAQTMSDNDIKEFVEEQLKTHNEFIHELEEMYKNLSTFMTILCIFLGTLGAVNLYEKKEMRKVVRKDAQTEIKIAKGEMKEILISISKIFSSTIELQEARSQLARTIADLDEPFIRHTVSELVKSEINKFTEKVKAKQTAHAEALKNVKDIKIETNQISDFVLLGKAYHYINDVENFKKAIKAFETALDLNKDNKDNDKIWFNDIYLRLGNSYAGCKNYPKAIKQYKQIKEENIQKFISMAHSYKPLLKFEEAITEMTKVIAGSLKDKDKNYWEAVYEKANLLVGLGQYSDALRLYTESIDTIKDGKKTTEPVWLYLSCGECVWKSGNNYPEAWDYYKKAQIEALSYEGGKYTNKVLYKQLRLYIDDTSKGDYRYQEACNLFLDGDKNRKDLGKVDSENLLNIYLGFALITTGQGESGRTMINSAVENLRTVYDKVNSDLEDEKEHRDKCKYTLCYPYYELAQGLAIQNNKKSIDEAIKLLRILINDTDFYFVKEWAKAAECSDFIVIKDNPEFKEIIELDKPQVYP